MFNKTKTNEYQSMVDNKYNNLEFGENEARLTISLFGQKIGVKISPPLPESEQTDYKKYDNDNEVAASAYFSPSEISMFVKNARFMLANNEIKVKKEKKDLMNTYISNSAGNNFMILHKDSDTEYSLEVREYSAKNPEQIVKSLFFDFDIAVSEIGFNLSEKKRKGTGHYPVNSEVENFISQLEMTSTVGMQVHQTQKNLMYHIDKISSIIQIINGKLDSLFNGKNPGVGRGTTGNSKDRSYSRTSNASRGSRGSSGRSKPEENDIDDDEIEGTLD